ncbi:MAG: tetratricopeptide repeat protein [Verrucomicrobia bacterium]|nr:tetratricopeptide repeat protein [Verrucomicrobiota bacterium]
MISFNSVRTISKQQYDTAITKIQELLKAIGANKDAPLELLYFNIGLANLLGNKLPEAETAFLDCIKRFPNNEFTSRCHLGIGRSLMLQDNAEKKQRAVGELALAMQDAKYRSEAGLWLGQLYMELKKPAEALKVFRNLMGSDVRSPQQTMAAVEIVGLLAEVGKIDDLVPYLDHLTHQAGVRDSLAWFSNQVVVRGDELVSKAEETIGSPLYETALSIYRAVPSRSYILETQTSALEGMRSKCKILEDRVAKEQSNTINQRSNASELVDVLKPFIKETETSLAAIEKITDFDAALLMRRGRCLVYLERNEEALLCFRTPRTQYPGAKEAESAAFAEIFIYNKLKDSTEIKDKCDLFLTKYPESERAAQVATLAGEILLQNGDWAEIGAFYRGLATKFPKAENLDSFVFYQGVAFFQAANFIESTPHFEKFLKDFPNSDKVETVLYYLAMSNFLSNKYKATLATCKEYLAKYPDGHYAGDMIYRLAFIDFNDKGDESAPPEKQAAYKKKMADKIISELSAFLTSHPDNLANGAMYCLMADTYRRMNQIDAAIAAYQEAVKTDSLDDVIQYALDNATPLMQAKKDWEGIAKMHGDFITRKPESQLVILSTIWVVRALTYAGKSAEASEMLATNLKNRIADPASEQVESLIDELVKSFVPRRKAKDIDIEPIDTQLVDLLNKIVVGLESATTNARIYYARARLAQMLKRNDLSDIYLKGIATSNAQDPKGLSPALLATSGDILLKNGDLEGAEAMYMRLADRYKDSMFSDAGPVGLGFVALARKDPEKALKIFDDAMDNNPGISRFKECTLGKLQALVEVEKYEAAEKLAEQIVSDKTFRGESAGKAYLLWGQAYRKQAAKSAAISPAVAKDFLAKAHGVYQRVYTAYVSTPEICAEGYWQAYETLKELGDNTLANETLKTLATHPKLLKTKRSQDAAKLVK